VGDVFWLFGLGFGFVFMRAGVFSGVFVFNGWSRFFVICWGEFCLVYGSVDVPDIVDFVCFYLGNWGFAL